MICVLSLSVLAFQRKAQLADEVCGFPVCCLKKKEKKACGGGVPMGRVGSKREEIKDLKTYF